MSQCNGENLPPSATTADRIVPCSALPGPVRQRAVSMFLLTAHRMFCFHGASKERGHPLQLRLLPALTVREAHVPTRMKIHLSVTQLPAGQPRSSSGHLSNEQTSPG
jgi:hypothetical protein